MTEPAELRVGADMNVSGDPSAFVVIDRVAMAVAHGTAPPVATGSIRLDRRRRDDTAFDRQRQPGATATDLQEDPIDITLLYFPDCPNWRTADEHLRSLADEALADGQHDITISRTASIPAAPPTT